MIVRDNKLNGDVSDYNFPAGKTLFCYGFLLWLYCKFFPADLKK